MKLQIYRDYNLLCRAAADMIAAVIQSKPDALICIASGHTPIGVFRCLVDDVKKKKLNISRCVFVSLDEWLGIPADQEGSCRNMMDIDFFHPLAIPESSIVFFDGMSDAPEKECERIDQFISERKGLDVMLVGVGLNGHIAMNEPGTEFERYAHVSQLAEETKMVGQKYFSGQTKLSQGLTLGLRHFKEAKLPILMANGTKKAAIMKVVLTPPTRLEIPASIVHQITQSVVLLDEGAAT